MSALSYVMTEQSWLACVSPQLMLRHLPCALSDRKLRLYAVACCRHIWDLLIDPRSRNAVEIAERFAEGTATLGEFSTAGNSATDFVHERSHRFDFPYAIARSGEDAVESAAEAAAASAWGSALDSARGSEFCTAKACRAASIDSPRTIENAILCDLLRDIVGNPFRPVAFNSERLTPTVRAIARAIYEARRFEDLPILGDALEEAGCASEEILEHCRRPTTHGLGCWVLDLVLGKQ